MAFNYGVFTKVYNLIERAQSGDGEALEMLVECNGGLVKKIALKYTGCGYELEDLIQIGYIGLIKAIDKFDIDLDYMFSTYAVPMIIGEIKSDIDNPENRIDNMILESAMEKLPVNSQRLIGCRYFKDMTQQETAKVMGMTQVQVSRMEKKVIINLKKLISEQM